MLSLKDYLECVEYHIGETAKYLWNCYGENAYIVDNWTQENKLPSNTITVIYDFCTKLIYEINAWDEINKRQYRWIHPVYIAEFKKECESRRINWKNSIDNWDFIDLESEHDIMEKARAIVGESVYDTRILTRVNLSEDNTLILTNLAEQAGMSISDYISNVLEQTIIVEKIKGNQNG